MLHASTYSAFICLTQIGHYRLKRFCFIVEQIACLFNAGVGDYVKSKDRENGHNKIKDFRNNTKTRILETLWLNARFGLNLILSILSVF